MSGKCLIGLHKLKMYAYHKATQKLQNKTYLFFFTKKKTISWNQCFLPKSVSNKTTQANTCYSILVTSANFTSKLVFNIHNFGNTKIPKKWKSLKLWKFWHRFPPPEGLALFCFSIRILSLKTHKDLDIGSFRPMYFFFAFNVLELKKIWVFG